MGTSNAQRRLRDRIARAEQHAVDMVLARLVCNRMEAMGVVHTLLKHKLLKISITQQCYKAVHSAVWDLPTLERALDEWTMTGRS